MGCLRLGEPVLGLAGPVDSNVISRIGIHALATNRALTVLVSLQPISTKYSRDADACDQ